MHWYEHPFVCLYVRSSVCQQFNILTELDNICGGLLHYTLLDVHEYIPKLIQNTYCSVIHKCLLKYSVYKLFIYSLC